MVVRLPFIDRNLLVWAAISASTASELQRRVSVFGKFGGGQVVAHAMGRDEVAITRPYMSAGRSRLAP